MEEQRTGDVQKERRSKYKHCEGAGRGEVKLHTQAKMGGKKGKRSWFGQVADGWCALL